MFFRTVRISGVFVVLILAGCATPVSTNIQPSPAQVAKYNELPALNVVEMLEKNVNAARHDNMPLLAPTYFREAGQVLGECQSALTNKPKDVVVNLAAKGQAILDKGRSIMAIVQYRFAKELEQKLELEEHNALKLLPKEYEAVIGGLSRLIGKVEREQPDNIDVEKDALLKSMRSLVINAVQEGALRESEAINAENKKKNADKQAPMTYAEALRVYQESKSQIAVAPHDKTLVQRLSAESLFAAHHAQQVNERVALLQSQLRISSAGGTQGGAQADGKTSGMEKVTLEKIVLQEEERLLGISSALRLKDLRDLSLEKQVEEIQRAATDAATQPNGEAIRLDFEARLKAANEGIQQGLAELAQKDKLLAEREMQVAEKEKLLAEKDRQMTDKDKQSAEKDKQVGEKSKQVAEKDKQLAEKDTQIKTLKNKMRSMKLM
jgi:hypothetical protein